MNVFIFDVDNTLTPPRQKILINDLLLLNKFISIKPVYLVSGSDYEKLNWQLPRDTLDKCAGVFTCLGNCFHIKDKIIYKNTFPQLDMPDLRKDLEFFISNSRTPIKTSHHIEERIGMINVSSVGRAASKKEREIYSNFEHTENERKKFVNFIKQKYPFLDASVGGEISIDISVRGYDKSQILNHLEQKQNTVFFGDRCDVGGNDEPLAKEILKNGGIVYNVKDFKETFKILKKLIMLEEEG